ncbi:MAG TPA: hypothetical protein PK275_07785 [Chitinophagaceae bacterium]|jgi:hypothetical protein|nr:hypothetical protein [Chitinophagaceae bacterium]
MKKIIIILLILSGVSYQTPAQSIDSIRFFTDESVININLSTDIKQLQTSKGDEVYQDADVSLQFSDSTIIKEKIRVAARGHFRREFCNIPPLLLNFKNTSSPRLASLGKLKLVIGCGKNTGDESLIFKEYLIYKMYNLLEQKSFRVRLVKVNYSDLKNRVKPFTQFAFFIEDDKDLATRSDCIKMKNMQYLTESTDRTTMTKVAVFEYMISNGDWSVPTNHNIKLIFSKSEPTIPYAVPYDFDHSGFVNAEYASPAEILGTTSVTERVYRGFPRTMSELQICLDIFRAQKTAINNLILNFNLLSSRTRKEANDYINEFYRIIEDKHDVEKIFIDNARKN